MALFRSGRYNFKYDHVNFDMGAHNRLLSETREEVAAFRSRQATAQVEMMALEKESMTQWMAEKAKSQVPANEIETLQQGQFSVPCFGHGWVVGD